MIYRKKEHPDEFDVALKLVDKLFGPAAVMDARKAGEVAVVNPKHIAVIDDYAAKIKAERAAREEPEQPEEPAKTTPKKPRKPRKKPGDSRSRRRWRAFNRFVDTGHEAFTPAEQVVWHKVFRHVKPDDTVVVSNDFLMRGTGRSKKIVIAAIQKMQALGYLKLVGLIPSQEGKTRRFAWLYEQPEVTAEKPSRQGGERTLAPPVQVVEKMDTASPLRGPK